MSIASHFLARAAKLPPPRNKARVATGIRVPVPDGVTLETVHASPIGDGPFPTLLMRCPYGLRGFVAVAELYAERGYHVVLQACRGTSKSGGAFEPLKHEREDGLATLDWIKAQPWFDGRLGTTGPSYLGYVQWAIADALPPHSAMAVKVSSAEFKSLVFPGGAFHIGLWLSWVQLIDGLKHSPLAIFNRLLSGGIDRTTAKAALTLPLENADRVITGNEVPFWRRWIEEAIGDDDFWQPMDHRSRLGPTTPPVSFVSGWYDMMLDQLLCDYTTLVAAGHTPQLTVGPWWHISPELQTDSIADTLPWMDHHLRGEGELRRKPVRLHVSGLGEWREFDAYPPPPAELRTLHLQPGRALAAAAPAGTNAPDRYRYDPANPTPSLGGAIFAFSGAGPVDQASLERRNDVLVFTGEPLAEDLTIIGKSEVSISVRPSLPNYDILVKLCDVDESGVSRNICDGFIRRSSRDATPVDGFARLDFTLHATAHLFRRGHRLRVLIASGAHPRIARNTGTDEPFGTATTLKAVDIEIFHDPAHPSSIRLPVVAL